MLLKTRFPHVAPTKRELRAAVREAGKCFDETQRRKAAAHILARVEQLPEFAAAHTVALYWSLPDEVPTHEFVHKWSGRKRILLPSCCGLNDGNDIPKLIFRLFDPAEALIPGFLGIMECCGDEVDPAEIDMAIVPGVAFDRTGNRLGRGKGLYDRFLSAHPNLYKTGICFDYQLIEKIPAEAHDIKMDTVISG